MSQDDITPSYCFSSHATNKQKKDLEINRSQNNLKLGDTENLWLGNVA